MVKTQKKSPLYADFYYPEEAATYKNELEIYKKFGFYWPTEDDLIKLT